MRRFRQWGVYGAPLLLVFAGLSRTAQSQVAPPDTTPLSFSGIPAGASLALITGSLRRLEGTRLGCLRSRSDQSVEECRATFKRPTSPNSIEVWLSAMDSLAGIITFKHTGSSTQLDRWRNDLEQRYGMVPTQVQGPQRMKQWVRRGRMIRLTWRREAGGTTVSVSLVDGRVLDEWGARQKRVQ